VLVDTHCHVIDDAFAEGPDAVLERALGEGVTAFVCVGVGGLEAARRAVQLAERRADVVATVGIHPHDASSWAPELERELVGLLAHERVVAVGEVGLDHHYDHSPRDAQERCFRRFVSLARELRKPLVIHTRSAKRETLDVLREEGARDVGGVIHCFSEDVEFARAALELGFYLSFSGIVTFKNAESVQAAARFAPADRILLETDAPYLAPVPVRGKRCEPAFVVHTARRVAELRGVVVEALIQQTGENARALFRWLA
jgi:TatD DNase family protein